MSHLRPVGENIDAFLLAAPKGSSVAQGMKTDRKGKGRAVDMFALPEGVLASQEEVPVKEVWRREEAVPEELQGLQPDMDPHLRQVLEALEDDTFVQEQEEDGDGWFDELVGGGERVDEGEGEEWGFREQGIEDGDGDVPNGDDKGADREGETWQDRFKAFKREKQDVADGCVMDEADQSEMADTVGSLASNLRDLTVVGGKKRRGKRGPSDASGMSMSSSSMFRNQGLRDLDDRFDRVSWGRSGITVSTLNPMLILTYRLRANTSSKTMTTISPMTMTTQYPWRRPICPVHHACRSSLPAPQQPETSREKISTQSWMISWTIMRWWVASGGRAWAGQLSPVLRS